MTQQREKRLLNEWLAEFHPTDLQWRRVRLGAIPTKRKGREFLVGLRWCDAIYIKDDIVHIVEAKIKPDLGVIGQLEHYHDLFYRTPEFSQYKDKQVQLVLLTAWPDLEVKALCMKKGIEYVLYQPEWILPYLAERFKVPLADLRYGIKAHSSE